MPRIDFLPDLARRISTSPCDFTYEVYTFGLDRAENPGLIVEDFMSIISNPSQFRTGLSRELCRMVYYFFYDITLKEVPIRALLRLVVLEVNRRCLFDYSNPRSFYNGLE